jgi:hypothetical protein
MEIVWFLLLASKTAMTLIRRIYELNSVQFVHKLPNKFIGELYEGLGVSRIFLSWECSQVDDCRQSAVTYDEKEY